MGVQKGLASIIIVSWNSEDFIEDAVSTALKQQDVPCELIVVDNGSTDRTVEILKSRFKGKLKLIENRQNEGFCRSNNTGLKQSKGEYVLFLNPDTRMESDFLKNAIEGFDDPKTGAVSGLLLRFDKETVDSAGQTLAKNRRPVEIGYERTISGDYLNKRYCFSVCGAAALYKRSVIEELMIGEQFFDEDYFAFYEDLDAGWRMNLYGWNCRYIPEAVIYHYRGGTGKSRSALSKIYKITGRNSEVQAHIIRNRWFTMMKNDHIINFLLHLPWILIQEIKTLLYLLFFQPRIIIPLYRGFFKKMSSMLQKRKIIKINTKTGFNEIRRRMK